MVTGEWRQDLTAKVPTADAPAELKEGVEVQLSNGLQATVAEVTPEHVVIDANHMLAGKDLTFEVELVKLQKVELLASCSKSRILRRLIHTACHVCMMHSTLHSIVCNHATSGLALLCCPIGTANHLQDLYACILDNG